ncbi:MAG: ABC transporter ATP-binding protein [Caldisericia bacterium]|jgi:ABC-2 type transport system ATP-binding protein|nr:ABC transporter ATP-binding protein [Caldisericia bacterium]
MVVIEVKDLKKYYGEIKAVDGVSFYVSKGEVFGMVGPNGAGKTTTIECIEGLRKPTSGEIRVLGLNPYEKREILYKRISVQLQETRYQDKIKVYEILKLFSSFYEKPLNYEYLLERFELKTLKNSFVSDLSGGQKQKLSIILALLPNPEIIFLDELTTGLDPKARRDMWKFILDLKKEGKTIFLTTHYMEEAENLCDRVAIIDHGKIIALDAPENIIKMSNLNEIITFEGEFMPQEKFYQIKGLTNFISQNGIITLFGKGEDFLKNVVDFLYTNKIYFKNLKTKKPNLEDVYLSLTGRVYEEAKQ